MAPLPETGVVDADGHVLEDADLWDRYLEPDYRDRPIRIVQDEAGWDVLEVAGQRSSFAISVGKRRASSPMVASMISSSLFPIQFVSPPASLEQGANTSSSIERSSSAYSLQVVDMSA